MNQEYEAKQELRDHVVFLEALVPRENEESEVSEGLLVTLGLRERGVR